jgi:hypothetical protein
MVFITSLSSAAASFKTVLQKLLSISTSILTYNPISDNPFVFILLISGTDTGKLWVSDLDIFRVDKKLFNFDKLKRIVSRKFAMLLLVPEPLELSPKMVN